ncbi:hypothetical protein BKA69DRAFT_1174904 [Paraphysoderma sedebokerense]|nr:hypothetical protein BKA69DRAFT_1174904 [Paraphysoderma sedebokerense]
MSVHKTSCGPPGDIAILTSRTYMGIRISLGYLGARCSITYTTRIQGHSGDILKRNISPGCPGRISPRHLLKIWPDVSVQDILDILRAMSRGRTYFALRCLQEVLVKVYPGDIARKICPQDILEQDVSMTESEKSSSRGLARHRHDISASQCPNEARE